MQGAEVAKRINDEERGARAAVKIIGKLPLTIVEDLGQTCQSPLKHFIPSHPSPQYFVNTGHD
jgi:hypothetical protein